ncbi:MAG: hypothetical protein PWP70_1390 [Moorella sp. (in: firmicutes)]|nr:hypothetical protein [Moorella sp. (in: firmicutes)]
MLKALRRVNLGEDISPMAATLFATLMDTEYDAVALLNNEPRMIYVNRNYERIVGLKPEEVVGKHVKDLIREGKFERAPSLEVLATKKPYSFFQKMRNGGDVLITANPLLDAAGNVILIIDNLRDVTDLNRLKEESLRYRLQSNIYEKEALELRARSSYPAHITACSLQMRQVVEQAIRAASVNATVLITGESGVGKGVIAKFIHIYSARSGHPFIQVNCSAIPESLFESELFGYEEGAFSGARRKGKPGLLEVAAGGTLLLDEIGDLPLAMQAKLLHFLQERHFFRVGGTREVSVDVRIIAATNADLEQKIRQNEFREDLYYRLNVIPISIPPLRERIDDIIPMAAEFLERFNKQYNKQKVLTFEAEAVLRTYSWPGNVRQLQNVMERLVILSETDRLTGEPVRAAIGKRGGEEALPPVHVTSLVPWPEAMRQLEYQLLQMAARQFPTARQIARTLQVSHPTVSKKLQQYGITLTNKAGT